MISNVLIEGCLAQYSAGLSARENTIIADSIVRGCTAGVHFVVSLWDYAVMDRCQVIGNRATYSANVLAAGYAKLMNSLIVSNRSLSASGKAGVDMSYYWTYAPVAINCTIAYNEGQQSGGAAGLAHGNNGSVTNCIIYYNTAASAPHNYSGDLSTVGYSCAPDLTHGVNGNITNVPGFKDLSVGNYRLAAGSPCRDAGAVLPGITTWRDLDLKPRVQFGGVDMGAYESPPPAGTIMVVR